MDCLADLDRAVQQSNGKQFSVWTDPTAQDVICELEGPSVFAPKLLGAILWLYQRPFPELHLEARKAGILALSARVISATAP